MRRNDREIKDFNDIIEIIKQCDVCRLALNDKDYPYILPLNFGFTSENNKITLYFHGACEGKKYELIAKDNRASFEMDCMHNLISDRDKGYCTMEYKSVIGNGRIEIVADEEKYNALRIITDHYHTNEFAFNQNAVPQTTVLKLTVERITGKARIKKPKR